MDTTEVEFLRRSLRKLFGGRTVITSKMEKDKHFPELSCEPGNNLSMEYFPGRIHIYVPAGWVIPIRLESELSLDAMRHEICIWDKHSDPSVAYTLRDANLTKDASTDLWFERVEALHMIQGASE